MREKLKETPEEKQFDFSESYIFGKFDLFAKRLERVADVVSVVAAYAPVLDIRLEGIEPIQTRYKLLFETIRKRNYDMTDIRRTEVPLPLPRMPSLSDGLICIPRDLVALATLSLARGALLTYCTRTCECSSTTTTLTSRTT